MKFLPWARKPVASPQVPTIEDPDLRFVVGAWERVPTGIQTKVLQDMTAGLALMADRTNDTPAVTPQASMATPGRVIGFQMPAQDKYPKRRE